MIKRMKFTGLRYENPDRIYDKMNVFIRRKNIERNDIIKIIESTEHDIFSVVLIYFAKRRWL